MNNTRHMIESALRDARANLPNTRETSLVITKLEEAMMWLELGAERIAAKASENAGASVSSRGVQQT